MPAPAFITLFFILAYVPPIYSQLPGYISLDAGYTGVDYEDENGILWTSDSAFLSNAGEIANIQIVDAASKPKALQSVRYFPGNLSKYCYHMPNLAVNASYLVRSKVLYGNFDLLSRPSLFKYILDGTPIGNFIVVDKNSTIIYEHFFKAQHTFLDVCFAKLSPEEYQGGIGVPFINSLELRPLDSNMYEYALQNGHFLTTLVRRDYGLDSLNRATIGYPFDPYDRTWFINSSPLIISTNETINSTSLVPTEVMRTAHTSFLPGTSVNANFSTLTNSRVYLILYFAEIENVTREGERVFDIYTNLGDGNSSQLFYEGLDVFKVAGRLRTVRIRNTSPILFTKDVMFLELRPWLNSTSPPLINALEIYELSETPSLSTTNPNDVEAINLIQEHWNLTGWTGDPCMPSDFAWEWLVCISDTNPHVIGMYLTSFNLSGEIPSTTNNLTYLQEIFLNNNSLIGPIPDLSMLTDLKKMILDNNNLSGPIPDFLSKLPNLEELSLQNNNFSGEVPTELAERALNHSLNLRISGNPLLTSLISPAPPPNNSTTQNIPPISPVPEDAHQTIAPSPSQGRAVKVTFHEFIVPLFFITIFII